MLLNVTFNKGKSESDGPLWYNRTMSTPTLLEAKLLVRTLDSDALRELQDCLNARRLVLDGEAQFKLPRGTKVWFDGGRKHGTVYGTVVEWKRGGKAVVQPTHGALKWTVSGSLLNKQ